VPDDNPFDIEPSDTIDGVKQKIQDKGAYQDILGG